MIARKALTPELSRAVGVGLNEWLDREGEPMKDRELLELAAKAAGLDGYRWVGAGMALAIDPSKAETGSIGPNWNPLADDGDAFRLAVLLGIQVFSPDYPEYHGSGDACAAVRRAIVEAAARLGAV